MMTPSFLFFIFWANKYVVSGSRATMQLGRLVILFLYFG
jgi:hypothetical protein